MKCAAIKVMHPIGVFYLTTMSAETLLRVCFSSPHTRISAGADGSVEDVGDQRRLEPKRCQAISRYLATQDATIPGTIILAANVRPDGCSLSEDGEDSKLEWYESSLLPEENLVWLNVPTYEPVATVVDGQHRLWGFKNVSSDIQQMQLPCAVFLDLPTAQQASIFATINFNQKPVSKSQTYELFGYNLDEEPEDSWSPDKLAVNFTRRLNVDEASPLRGHIKVAAIDDRVLDDLSKKAQQEWMISTATIVEGVLSLITNDQKRDRDLLNSVDVQERRRSLLKGRVKYVRDPPPFWEVYLGGDRDIVMYKTLLNYFTVVQQLFWTNKKFAVLHKTAGIQALFRVLKTLLPDQLALKKLNKEVWCELLAPATAIDFSHVHFTESSGKGRSRIQDALLVALKRKSLEDVRDNDFREFLGRQLKGLKDAYGL